MRIVEVSMRSFIEDLEKKGKIEKISAKKEEIPGIIKRNPGKALLFDVEGYDYRVASGICGTRELIKEALGTEDLLGKISKAYKGKGKIIEKRTGKCQEIKEEADLRKLPVLQHHKEDKGPYITAGVVIAKDPELGYNLSFHRMYVARKDKLAVRILPRHLHQFHERNPELPVAIAIGLHPALLLAAATSFQENKNEYEVASKLLGELRVVKAGNGLLVPADAEIVMEGILGQEKADEGPFVDITGTIDIVRKEQVIRVERITHRKNPIYHSILPASSEHKLLMGMPREPVIYAKVGEKVKCLAVNLTQGGSSWLHGVVQIDKKKPGEGKTAVKEAFKAHKSMKMAIIVDKDIDPYNMEEVEWAMSTRFQADKDLIVFKEKGSSLDPSADMETRMTAKMGIDATMPETKGKGFAKAK